MNPDSNREIDDAFVTRPLDGAPAAIVDLCEKIGHDGIKMQDISGAMPCGWNGPHGHRMTPVRNTGHWAVFFSALYLKTGESSWARAADKALSYLTSSVGQPLGGAFHHRTENFKSSYNGLIGQAWTVEALSFGASALRNDHYQKAALKLVEQHVFNPSLALWHELDLDGALRRVGGTLNQQIWFMAMAVSCLPTENRLKATRFLNSVRRFARCRRSGLLYTMITFPSRSLPVHAWRWVRRLMMAFPYDNRLPIDAGYHIFTLLGITLLFHHVPTHPFYQGRQFKRILLFAFSEKQRRLLNGNPFGYYYNVTGFELPVIWGAFRQHLPARAGCVAIREFNRQLGCYIDYHVEARRLNSIDADTFMARFYEICRIPKVFWTLLSAGSGT